MEVFDFEQLPQHDFDLDIRSEEHADAKLLMARYFTLVTGQEKEDVSLDDFEKMLVSLIETNAAHVALINELNFTEVEPVDAAMVLKESIVPTDAVLDAIAHLRGPFDTAVEDYAQQLAETGKTLAAPVDPNPTDEQVEAARYRLARYVITSILVDDREEAQL